VSQCTAPSARTRNVIKVQRPITELFGWEPTLEYHFVKVITYSKRDPNLGLMDICAGSLAIWGME
jgi:hypothetical protein